MAVYKFRVVFEDYDEVLREIEIKSTQTFEDLHQAIHQSIGFKPDYSSSFYVSNDYWHKGFEITLLPEKIKDSTKTVLMGKARLCDYIEDPHQKFYYIFDFNNPWNFQIELIKIIVDLDPKKSYPLCVKTINEAPKQFGVVVAPSGSEDEVMAMFQDVDLDEEDQVGLKGLMTEGDDEDSEEDETESEEGDEEEEFGMDGDAAEDDY